MPWTELEQRVNEADTIKVSGKVCQVIGLLIESTGPSAAVGDICEICLPNRKKIACEVVGFHSDRLLLMPFERVHGIRPGLKVINTESCLKVPVGEGLIGRILDGLGKPIDGKGPLKVEGYYPLNREAPNPFERRRIRKQLVLGVRAIDGLLSIGRGQRIGIFSGSGLGKSTLIGMMTRYTSAPVIVLGLVGERGREVREFIEKDLGPEGLKRAVVVVSTSDKTALSRVKAAYTATSIAEYFRDQGKDVLLMMDSITRFALSLREIGLAVGEPPTTKGFPPSVFATLPQLLERTGSSRKGSITAFYAVLVEGDDLDEPVSDAVRGILDGHIVLSRKLSHENHYPAVDVLQSVSRLAIEISSKEHRELREEFVETYATYRSNEDLIKIGAYNQGSDPKIDKSINQIENFNLFLKQPVSESARFKDTMEMLKRVTGGGEK
ncbi:FliI/YscN family ATPase [Candidatus Riflebacteria bacterium]